MADSRRNMSRFFEDRQSWLQGGRETRDPASPGPSVGEILRARRQEFGYSLEDIEGALRIRRDHLAAIEDGDSAELPAVVYVLGYIRSYARLLELDGEKLAQQYKAQLGVAPIQTEMQFRVPVAEPRGVPGGAAMLIGLIIAAVAYGSWYYVSTHDRSLADLIPSLPERLGGGTTVVATPVERNPEPVVVVPGGSITAELPVIPPVATPVRPVATAAITPNQGIVQRIGAPTEQPQESVPEIPLVTPDLSPGSGPNAAVSLANTAGQMPRRDPTAAVAAVPAPAAMPTVAQPDPAGNPRVFGATGGPSRIAIRAVQESWLQVRDANNNTLHTRILQPGDLYQVPDQPGLRMNTGNAGGLQIMVDGSQSPWMGRSGEVVRNVPLEPANLMRGRNIGN